MYFWPFKSYYKKVGAMLNIVLFGAPGAGKGTQASRLIEKYNLNHISTGEIIREEIRSGSALGKSMQEYISRGELAPDELVIDIIAEYVKSHADSSGNIFDGFPRTTRQAEEFDRLLSGYGLKVDVMLEMDVPDEELVHRLLLRGRESGRADDASEEVIRNRLDVYKRQTAVVADYYSAQNKFIAVNGLGTEEEVCGRLCAEIDKML